MASREKPRIKDPRAVVRGKFLRQCRMNLGISQQAVADKLGLKSREAVAWWEGGAVKEIERVYRLGLCKLYGLEERELLLDPEGAPPEFKMPISNDAKSIAYRWDDLPEAFRVHLKKQIAETERILRESPGLAKQLYPELEDINAKRGK